MSKYHSKYISIKRPEAEHHILGLDPEGTVFTQKR